MNPSRTSRPHVQPRHPAEGSQFLRCREIGGGKVHAEFLEPERHEDRRVCPLIARGRKDDGVVNCHGPVLVEGRPIVIPRTLFTDLADDPPLEVEIDLPPAESRRVCQQMQPFPAPLAEDVFRASMID